MRYDVFMFNDEMDVLECRLRELEEVPDLRHVLIEATLDHQGHEKPLHYADNRKRFGALSERVVGVIARQLPTAASSPSPWTREHAQREHAWRALHGAQPDDIILHGDLDEIPRAESAAADPGDGYLGMSMREHLFAVDWLHPNPFRGTVITRLRNVRSFVELRYMRNSVPLLPDAGWHITCLGGPEAIRRKLESFCHLEMRDMLEAGTDGGWFYERGTAWGPPPELKLGAVQMEAVDVDDSWPRYIREGRAPSSWFRPRSAGDHPVTGEAGAAAVHGGGAARDGERGN